MNPVAPLKDVIFYLTQAKYFNNLWHEHIDFLNSESSSELSEIQKKFYGIQSKTFLQQKVDCQIIALSMAYDDATQQNMDYENCQLILAFDPHEKGVSGDGMYYGLYPKDRFDLACHIPKDELLYFLTNKQRQFFHLI